MGKHGIVFLATLSFVAVLAAEPGAELRVSSDSTGLQHPRPLSDRSEVYDIQFFSALGGSGGSCCLGCGLAALTLLASSAADDAHMWDPDYDPFVADPLSIGAGVACLAAFAAVPAASALGAYSVSRQMAPGGSFAGTVTGAYAGALIVPGVWGLAAIAGSEVAASTFNLVLPVAVILGSAAGAVAGYHLIHFDNHHTAWEKRIGAPALAVVPGDKDGKRVPEFRARLLTFRF